VVCLRAKILLSFLFSSLIYIGAFSFSVQGSTDARSEIININTSWVDYDLLKVDVVFEAGEISSVLVNLSDYIGTENNAPFIEIQAVDLDGRQLGIVKISNPLYPDGLPRTNAIETNDPILSPKLSKSEFLPKMKRHQYKTTASKFLTLKL
jgi:hypothetical protein